jgi:protein SCO1/2
VTQSTRAPLGLLLLLAIAATGPPARATDTPHHAHEAAEPGEARRGESVYQLAGSLRDQTGARVGLDVFRGHPVLVSMFYASCPDACPLLIEEIRQFESTLPVSVRADLRVLLVSLDPARDTPEALHRLARAHGIGSERWRLVTAEDDVVREIAAVLGVKFRQLPDGTINHSTVITLLDRAGRIDLRLDGLGQPKAALAARVRAIAGRKPS